MISTINAVYAIAEGIHRTLLDKCGANYNGICPKFYSDPDTYSIIMQKMDEMMFMDLTNLIFDFVDREAMRDIEFKRFDQNGIEVKVCIMAHCANMPIQYAAIFKGCENDKL